MTADTTVTVPQAVADSERSEEQGAETQTNGEGNSYESWKSPIDTNLYVVDFEFFSNQTGITDPDELKRHILQVQAEAFEVHPYPCIRNFSFSKTKINHYPAYAQLLALGKERAGALFLDVGCGVGNDVRRAVSDGFPAKQAIASDLHPEFWEIGHKLFKSTPESFPARFVPGNIFEPSFLEPRPITYDAPPQAVDVDVASLENLTPLVGRLSAVHASSFFHLFDEAHQVYLAKKLASLLSPEPGSIIFGSHGGLPEKGTRIEELERSTGPKEVPMFCHSPESWKRMWETEVFGGSGKVEVRAVLKEVQRRDLVVVGGDATYYFLVWSVKRL